MYIQALAESMMVNTTLLHIRLEKCDFEERDIAVLCNVFQVHKFEVVELHNNKFSDNDIMRLSRSLHNSSKLRELNMSNCEVGDVGVGSIAEVIATKPLTKLMLANNAIGNKGASALADVLSSHEYLKSLSLEGNPSIQKVGRGALCHMLQRNSSIQEINFGEYSLGSEAIAAMRLLHLYGVADKQHE